ncbi:MAG: ATP-dependent protease LonB [Candidatus Woesearchaeota archaeon]
MSKDYTSTADIDTAEKIIDQVVGQEEAVNIIKKAAKQRRHVLLIGEPGTGKSMLGLGLAELLPKEKLVDIVSFANPNDENQPLIRTFPAGDARAVTSKSQEQANEMFKNQNVFVFVLAILAMIAPWWILHRYESEIMFAAFFLGGMVFLAAAVLFVNMGKRMGAGKVSSPKIIVDNFSRKESPFFDGTGAHAGALLGDVLHDPFQSGGLGTPAHERVVAGMIHKAHMGVLFLDEIGTLQPHTQQELLTALQEGKFSITGQSERSAGAMVRTEAVPCNFILVAAGNNDSLERMHPALRSRIRGYGYEVFMQETMPDTSENRERIAVFVAQEVARDKKIPHFSKAAVERIIEEARKRANRAGRLTLRLRELGGIIRAAGDVAVEEGADLVEPVHITKAITIARTLEHQMADRYIERKKEYEVIATAGAVVGRVNGLAVMGSGSSMSGIVLPIEGAVTAGGGKEVKIVATGKLGEIAKEAVTNVSAIVKYAFGKDLQANHEIFIQFLQTYEGVEGDSASIAVATAIISALKALPVRQDVAMTGSLSIRGDVLPIGGVTNKVEAAIQAGIKTVLVPKTNMKDIVLGKEALKQIQIVPVDHIVDVLEHALLWKGRKKLLSSIKKVYGR